MSRYLCLLLICLFIAITSFGQQTSYNRKGNEITLQNATTTLKIDFCTPSLFRVRSSWNKQFEANEKWMVVKYDWPAVSLKNFMHKDHIRFETDSLIIKVYTPSLRIDVLNKK